MTKQGAQTSMKDSGVPWLGRVPSHWDVVQSRRLFSERNEKAKPDDLQLTVSQKYGLLPQAEFMEREGRRVVIVQKGHDILKRVCAGDFVISMRSFQGGLEWSGYEGSVSSAYVPLYPIKWVVPRYFRWLFKSSTYIQALQSTSDLVRDGQALRFENFSKVPLPVVPTVEQEQIAGHLDRATTRIDALVAKKTRFIELLREKRQALITRAVTRGLDPTVSMKDSGVEWLGEMPAHWRASRLKHLMRSMDQGWSPQCESSPASENEWGVLKVGCVNGGKFDPAENKALPIGLDPRDDLTPKVGDVLVSRANTRELVGSCAVIETEFPFLMLCDKLYRIRTNERALPAYMARLIQVFGRRAIEEDATGTSASMVNISMDTIRTLKVVVPPTSEQQEIINYLGFVTTRIDTLIAKTERSIELLREKRTALITAAVTGKLDLREAA